ncbi:MAG: putative pterin-4-alpha-carbinolamine dehydratase [Chlamydiae bacterium]|nr:putative pterin-4-alpha-carbinolamine dehydratase [Chlamydiota bacterium]
MSDLANKKCLPCTVETTPLRGDALKNFHGQLSEGWNVVEEHHLERDYKFKDFKEALAFVNDLAALAEDEGHHPDIHLTWGKVQVTFWTHKIKGLSESDFVMAAKCDALYISRKGP